MPSSHPCAKSYLAAAAVCEGRCDSRRRITINVRLLKARQAGAPTLAVCRRRPSVPCSGCVLRTRCLTFLSAERDARVVETSRPCGEFGALELLARSDFTKRVRGRDSGETFALPARLGFGRRLGCRDSGVWLDRLRHSHSCDVATMAKLVGVARTGFPCAPFIGLCALNSMETCPLWNSTPSFSGSLFRETYLKE